MATVILPQQYRDFGVNQNKPEPRRGKPPTTIPKSRKRPLPGPPPAIVRVDMGPVPFKKPFRRPTDIFERGEFFRAAGPFFTGKLTDGSVPNAYIQWLSEAILRVPPGSQILSNSGVSKLFKLINNIGNRIFEINVIPQLTMFARYQAASLQAEFLDDTSLDRPNFVVMGDITGQTQQMAELIYAMLIGSTFGPDKKDFGSGPKNIVFQTAMKIDNVVSFILSNGTSAPASGSSSMGGLGLALGVGLLGAGTAAAVYSGSTATVPEEVDPLREPLLAQSPNTVRQWYSTAAARAGPIRNDMYSSAQNAYNQASGAIGSIASNIPSLNPFNNRDYNPYQRISDDRVSDSDNEPYSWRNVIDARDAGPSSRGPSNPFMDSLNEEANIQSTPPRSSAPNLVQTTPEITLFQRQAHKVLTDASKYTSTLFWKKYGPSRRNQGTSVPESEIISDVNTGISIVTMIDEILPKIPEKERFDISTRQQLGRLRQLVTERITEIITYARATRGNDFADTLPGPPPELRPKKKGGSLSPENQRVAQQVYSEVRVQALQESASRFGRKMAKYNNPSSNIDLEIPESEIIEDFNTGLKIIKQIDRLFLVIRLTSFNHGALGAYGERRSGVGPNIILRLAREQVYFFLLDIQTYAERKHGKEFAAQFILPPPEWIDPSLNFGETYNDPTTGEVRQTYASNEHLRPQLMGAGFRGGSLSDDLQKKIGALSSSLLLYDQPSGLYVYQITRA